MNNVISFGTHKYYKKIAVKQLNIKKNERVLDLASGTGDLAKIVVADYSCEMICCDPNNEMLKINPSENSILAIAEELPFSHGSFDKVIIGFGIRNFQSLDISFRELNRILKNDGKLVIIEFGQPRIKLFRGLRDFYLKHIIPIISKIVTGKYSEYRYLARSVADFPDQKIIAEKLRSHGLTCDYAEVLFGAIAIYECRKIK